MRNTFEALLEATRSGRLSRRDILRQALVLGLTAPAISALLAACGGDDDDDDDDAGAADATATPVDSGAQPTPTEAEEDDDEDSTGEPGDEPTATEAAGEEEPTPTEEVSDGDTGERGSGGPLNILWWQAPVVLNGHLSVASKDIGAIRICMEPLADYDANGELVPFLASEIPSKEAGTVAEDQSSVTWKLREGVVWHDGEPFNAEDVVFTFEYLSDPATNATTLGFYSDIESVEALDDYTVQINFKNPVAAWFNPFVGASGTILPEHILRDSVGADAEFAPFNLMPVGTGPFKVVEFNPGDVVIYEFHENYWDPDKPHFDRVELKGGGDAVSAARAVVQSGEADWAWNLQVEAAILESLEQSGGEGVLVSWPGAGTEKLVINHSDPETELDGQKSHRDVPHPHLSDLRVRQAVALAIPRDDMANELYGAAGTATGYTMNESPRAMPDGITWEYDIEAANALLDEAGATPNDGGVRELNGREMRWISSASLNSLRQKEQEIMKESFAELGIELEIAAIEASVYFDASNIDSFQHLYFDFGLERNSGGLYPLRWYVRYLAIDPLVHIAQQENGWSGRNFGRYQNQEFNDLYARVETEIEEDVYYATFREMQQLVVDDVADIGLVSTNSVAAASNSLAGYEPSPFSTDVWNIKDWRRA